MKRSEAIKLIYEAMKDNHFGQYGEFYRMAGSVLDALENEGMLPPPVPKLQELKFVNEWDEEDD